MAPQLLPGDYRIVAENRGFKRLEIGPIKVNVGTTVTQDLTLELGGVTETVEVTASTNLVQTTSGQVGTTVQVSHVLEMPLVDRNVFSLVNLAPGASFNAGRASIAGGRTISASATLDGINTTIGGLGDQFINLQPPVDSMQEFKVEVANLSAEFGRTSAGSVNAITKSGTNEFHGSFYEFLRNDKLDAVGWGNDSKPPLRRNNFGTTIGGPIRRNQTFFFHNYDGLRQGTGQTLTRDVGLPEWRTGDFSRAMRDAGGRSVPVIIYDPETGTGNFANPRGNTPFPNNTIPSARLDPVAVKAAAFIPQANRAPNNSFDLTGNWQTYRVNAVTIDYHTIRVDHRFNSNTNAYVRYLFTKPHRINQPYTPEYGDADPDGIEGPEHRGNLVINLSHVFSPTFILSVTAGVNRHYADRRSGACCDKQDFGKLLGISNVPGNAFPSFDYAGGTVPVTRIGQFANVGVARRVFATVTKDFMVDFTRIRGAHTVKFGGAYTRFGGNEGQLDQPSGTYNFNGRFTQGVQASGTAIANTGINFADFLLGRLNTAALTIQPTVGKRIHYFGGYIQDDYRVTSRLTINLGLRYETETPVTEVASRMSNFDRWLPSPLAGTGDIPQGALGVVTFADRNGNGKYLWNWDKNNIAPRLGFAWRVFGTNNTVVRGGVGLFFGQPYDRNPVAIGKSGFNNQFRVQHPVAFRLRDGFPPDALANTPESELTATYGMRGTRFETTNRDFYERDRSTQYNQSLNLTLQHQWQGILFEGGYIGSLARHIPYPMLNMNHVPPELLARTEIPIRLRRPWTVFGSDQSQIQAISPTWGISNYHALTFKSERLFRNGVGWTVAYTFTKWIDNVTFAGATPGNFGDNDTLQNIYYRRGERSASTNGVPHRIVMAPIIDLPFGKGKRWAKQGGIMNLLAGGWQVASITTLRSGAPFGVLVLNGPRDILGDTAAFRVLRPDLLRYPTSGEGVKGRPAVGVRGLQWLDGDAFAVPSRFALGNASRTLPGVLGPGVVNFDSMVAKNFRFGDRWRAQFRWEMFDMFNTPQFGQPNDMLGGNAFGVVTTADGRRIMQFGLKLYW